MALAAKRRLIPKRAHQYSPPPPPPTREELRRILNTSRNAKTRAAVALMAFAGLKAQYIQTLTLKDVPDLNVQSNTVQFTKTPAKIVPQSKWRNTYLRTFTFLCEPGCTYLANFLKERQGKGENLTQQSQVIPFSSPSIIALAVKQAVRAAGFDFRPYDLRRYFLTSLMAAEAEGLIHREVREFISGYVVKAPLTLRRPTPQMEQMMREAYRKSAEKYLIP